MSHRTAHDGCTSGNMLRMGVGRWSRALRAAGVVVALLALVLVVRLVLVPHEAPTGMIVDGVKADGMTLSVGVGACDARVTVVGETQDEVVLAAFERRDLLPDFGGTDECPVPKVDVRLDRPLGERKVRDAHTGQAVTVYREPGA